MEDRTFRPKIKIKGARAYQARKAAKRFGLAKVLSDQREAANTAKVRKTHPDYKPPNHGKRKK